MLFDVVWLLVSIVTNLEIACSVWFKLYLIVVEKIHPMIFIAISNKQLKNCELIECNSKYHV